LDKVSLLLEQRDHIDLNARNGDRANEALMTAIRSKVLNIRLIEQLLGAGALDFGGHIKDIVDDLIQSGGNLDLIALLEPLKQARAE
jgi:hypothetical protein